MRQYIIINMSEIDKVDFNQICETSIDTIIKSVDGTKTTIKWDNEQPLFVDYLTTKEGPYNDDEILEVLQTDIWCDLSYNNEQYKII